jgi:hypothetical protein
MIMINELPFEVPLADRFEIKEGDKCPVNKFRVSKVEKLIGQTLLEVFEKNTIVQVDAKGVLKTVILDPRFIYNVTI